MFDLDSHARSRLVRVLVVDDHRMVREWVCSRLTRAGFSVVGEASNAADALEEARLQQPEVVILDLRLPDASGTEVCSEIVRDVPGVAVIVLTGYGDEELVREAIRAGARAYVLKDAEELDLPDVVDRVLSGESVLDPRAAGVLLRTLGSRRLGDEPRFSDQELNILRLAAEGFTNPEIGARLYLSRHTVKEYLSNAMRKLEVSSRVQAVLEATRLGLIDPAGETAASPRNGYHASRN